MKIELFLLLTSVLFKRSLTNLVFKKCTLHDQGGAVACLVYSSPPPVPATFPDVARCAIYCQLLNSNSSTSEVYTQVLDAYFSSLSTTYTPSVITLVKMDLKQLIHVAYDDFYMTLNDFPPMNLTSTVMPCSSFNYHQNSGLCEVFSKPYFGNVYLFNHKFCHHYKVSCFLFHYLNEWLMIFH